MPIYEYQCTKCGHDLEALQKVSDAPLTTCPQCQQQTLRKLVSAASFRLKGGGWYETDFKTSDRKNLAEGSNSGSPAKDSDTAAPATATAETKASGTGKDNSAGSSKPESKTAAAKTSTGSGSANPG